MRREDRQGQGLAAQVEGSNKVRPSEGSPNSEGLLHTATHNANQAAYTLTEATSIKKLHTAPIKGIKMDTQLDYPAVFDITDRHIHINPTRIQTNLLNGGETNALARIIGHEIVHAIVYADRRLDDIFQSLRAQDIIGFKLRPYRVQDRLITLELPNICEVDPVLIGALLYQRLNPTSRVPNIYTPALVRTTLAILRNELRMDYRVEDVFPFYAAFLYNRDQLLERIDASLPYIIRTTESIIKVAENFL